MSEDVKLIVKFEGAASLHNLLGAAGQKAPQAVRRAVNRVGDKARLEMVRVLAAQTGLPVRLMKRAVKVTRARDGGADGFVDGKGSLEYVIHSRGGDVGLKFFKPVEKNGGVYARPWGKPQFFPGAFTKSGPLRHRKINPKFHGRVLRNIGEGRWGGKLKEAKSGVFIPSEMVSGETAAKFYEVVERDLPARLEHELLWIMGEKK